MPADTIVSRLHKLASQTPQDPALRFKKNGSWVTLTWKDYADLVQRVGRAFMSLGHQTGQVVTILSNNRVEWVAADVGAMAIGGVATGIYQTCTAEQVAYIIDHSEAPICIVENESQLQKLEEQRSNFPNLKWAVLLDGAVPGHLAQWVMSWDALLQKADATPVSAYTERAEALQPGQLATLIYTSGTTGNPKGVMLSHHNLTWTADSLKQTLPPVEANQKHCGLSYLPLSHIAEQVLTIHVPITMGSTIWFAESLEKLKENLPEARPSIFFGVPRVWEKFEAALTSRLGQATGFKAFMANFARNTATEVNSVRETGKEPSGLLAIKYAIASKLVFSKLKGALGLDNCKLFVSGAAPISRSTLDFFRSLDIVIREVYGQSEGTGPTTLNTVEAWRTGTVGKPIPGCEVKLAPDGEILLKGGNVFMGYFKNQEATDECLKDGWLYSGDVGEFDSSGFLRITDRKKDLIITAGGKNVAPQNIEKLLKEIPEVAQAVVIGDRRRYLSALLTLEPDASKRWAEAHGVSNADVATLSRDPGFKSHMQKQIEEVNKALANYETVKRFELLAADFTLETGELTPSMKIKRKVVNEKYKDTIEGMYTGA